MTTPDDLQRQFAELREEDAAGAPSFAGTLAAARARQEPRGDAVWAWNALAGAAVMLAVVALAIRWVGPSVFPGGTAQPMSTVDEWIAPTDDLLASALVDPEFDELAFFSSPTADLICRGSPRDRRSVWRGKL